MHITEVIFIPMVLFLVIVAPIWLVLHYRFKSRMAKGISDEEMTNIESMLETLDRLVDRIETLEEILDVEDPKWRKTRARQSEGERR